MRGSHSFDKPVIQLCEVLARTAIFSSQLFVERTTLLPWTLLWRYSRGTCSRKVAKGGRAAQGLEPTKFRAGRRPTVTVWPIGVFGFKS